MYKVRIDSFEGPFDLLVYLLENAKMNIYDIKVAEITEQYIDYLHQMGDLNVEVGSEFIVLAAVLIRLKARMLLPRVSSSGTPAEEEDPRKELADRLAEYVKVKKAAEMLQERGEDALAVHEKPAEDISEYLDNPQEILLTDEDKFTDAFLAFLEKKKRVQDVRHRYERVRRQRASIDERIESMSRELDRRLQNQDSVDFVELIPDNADRYDVTLSFMSLLEMIKEQDVDASQEETYGKISITRRRDKKAGEEELND